MRTDDFNYYLPAELIAQQPIEPRDTSRLLIVNRKSGLIEHHYFYELSDFLHNGDILVFNDSRVIPARLSGRKESTGGNVEILLLRRISADVWETLVKPGRRVRSGAKLELTTSDGNQVVRAEIIKEGDSGIRVVRFSDESLLFNLGKVALPPYIHEPLQNPDRYQTVYADQTGSVAAPTAGLHFTTELIKKIEDKGVKCLFVTLHVGLDTFRPVRENNPQEHHIHREYGIVDEDIARELSLAKQEGRRIICVGTTSVRLIEAAARDKNSIGFFEGWVDLFILPGYQFRLVDAMITNFHLPKSTLLMLVSAFAGKELIDRAYQVAIKERYRFYSFGDAMLII